MNDLDELLGDPMIVPEGMIAQDILDILGDDEFVQQAEPVIEHAYPVDMAALYADQESTINIEEMAPADTKPTPKKRAAKKGVTAKIEAKSASEGSPEPEQVEPKVKLPPAATKSEALGRRADPNDFAKFGFTPDQISSMLADMDAAPKKVGEKCYNLLRYVLGKDTLSNFTKIALRALKARHEKGEGMTVPELVKLYETGGVMHVAYQTGTARSQAQQQSRMFQIFGMADKTTGVMRLNVDHPFTKELISRLS